MPGLITHLLSSHQMLNKVEPDLQNIIKEYPASFYLGSQGPDIFFYYLPGFLNKETLNLGLLLHKNKTQDYILAMLDSAKHLSEESRNIALSYTCGYLSHYGIDSRTHPYIYYKTGFKQKGRFVKSIRHSLYHRKLETSIDTLLLKNLTSDNSSDKSLWEFFDLSEKETEIISFIISRGLKSAYRRNVSREKVSSILKYVVLATKYFQTPEGRKKKLLEFMEDLTIGEDVVENLSNDQGNIDFFNLNKDFWHNPWDDQVKNHETFVELYNDGLDASIKYANEAFSYINYKTNAKHFRNVVENLSMASGKDCKEDLDWKHYNVIFKS